MKTTSQRPTVFYLGLVLALLSTATASHASGQEGAQAEPEAEQHADAPPAGEHVEVHFLEIVTPAVDETCALLAKTHGVTFSEPVVEFGNARTAKLEGGGRISVRAPMRTTEAPVVRPYLLVDDINAAVLTAEQAGAMVALPPTQIPGQGTFSVYLLGGIQHGLWQIDPVDSDSQ